MTIQPGTDIGHYHILEQLGEGGMAVVYNAYDTQLEREVALKVIRTDNILPKALDRALKRFQIEAGKMAGLSHANIVKILDYGEPGDAEHTDIAIAPRLTGYPFHDVIAILLLVHGEPVTELAF